MLITSCFLVLSCENRQLLYLCYTIPKAMYPVLSTNSSIEASIAIQYHNPLGMKLRYASHLKYGV